jgi:hypothetical protein
MEIVNIMKNSIREKLKVLNEFIDVLEKQSRSLVENVGKSIVKQLVNNKRRFNYLFVQMNIKNDQANQNSIV